MEVAASAGSVREALGSSVDALEAAGVPDARLDAELLLADAMAVDRASLAASPEAGVAPPAARAFGEMLRRRLRREPVAYILGRKGFRWLDLKVDGRVLIPRPETEMLVDVALELAPESVLDIGTGSGAIALAVASELPGCRVVAADTSERALALAGENAERLGLEDAVEFVSGTIPEPPAELTLANLPYIAEGDWECLQPELRDWEPREAFLAGPEGLDVIRAVIPLVHSPALALEVGEGQADAVDEMLTDAGFDRVERRRDLAGIERVLVGQR